MATFLTVLARASLERNQKTMVGLFCKNNLLVVALDGLFFIWKTIKVALDRWWSYTVTIVREFAWTDLALVVFDCNALS